jgi:hypothetical protein
MYFDILVQERLSSAIILASQAANAEFGVKLVSFILHPV